MVETSQDLTVFGIIEVDGVSHRVGLPLPLLVQDGMLYIGDLAFRYFEEAETSKSSTALRQIGENILLASAGISVESGCGLVDLRLSLRPFVVGCNSFAAWRHALLSVSSKASREDILSFRISSTGFEVCSSLFWLSAYTSACDFHVSDELFAPKNLVTV